MSSTPTDSPTYRLTFTPARPRPGEPLPAPVARRLARLLKHALRALGLKCTLVEKLPAPALGVVQAGPGAARPDPRPGRVRRRE